jgi:hypothetical protein
MHLAFSLPLSPTYGFSEPLSPADLVGLLVVVAGYVLYKEMGADKVGYEQISEKTGEEEAGGGAVEA